MRLGDVVAINRIFLLLIGNLRQSMMDLKSNDLWLPALKPVRSPWLARLGFRSIPCVYSERQTTHVFLTPQLSDDIQEEHPKGVSVMYLLQM